MLRAVFLIRLFFPRALFHSAEQDDQHDHQHCRRCDQHINQHRRLRCAAPPGQRRFIARLLQQTLRRAVEAQDAALLRQSGTWHAAGEIDIVNAAVNSFRKAVDRRTGKRSAAPAVHDRTAFRNAVKELRGSLRRQFAREMQVQNRSLKRREDGDAITREVGRERMSAAVVNAVKAAACRKIMPSATVPAAQACISTAKSSAVPMV